MSGVLAADAVEDDIDVVQAFSEIGGGVDDFVRPEVPSCGIEIRLDDAGSLPGPQVRLVQQVLAASGALVVDRVVRHLPAVARHIDVGVFSNDPLRVRRSRDLQVALV